LSRWAWWAREETVDGVWEMSEVSGQETKPSYVYLQRTDGRKVLKGGSMRRKDFQEGETTVLYSFPLNF
jgi:hypothetical protein